MSNKFNYQIIVRRILFIILLSCVNINSQNLNEHQFIFFKNSDIEKMKEAIENNEPIVHETIKSFEKLEKYYIDKGPWSVTFVPSPAASGNPHDFFSEGPYWWPDPNNLKGPYIRKDGVRNPDRFVKHDDDMSMMCEAVLALGLNSYFLKCEKCAERAIEFIKVWFLNDETKMNPNVQYAQAIKNLVDGRGIGIIDSRCFIYLLEGINFLNASDKWSEENNKKLKLWFDDYLYWLTNSQNGIDEKENGNNHSTWWSAQVAAISDFTGDSEKLKLNWEFLKNTLIENQIEADGSLPEEEARTKSLSYSAFNLDAFSLVLRVAQLNGINLWSYENSIGGSIKKSVEYIFPYVKAPENWKKNQISPFEIAPRTFLVFAGEALNHPDCFSLYKKYLTISKEKNNLQDSFTYLLNLYLMVKFNEND